jgi:hypothetical protein
MKTYLDCIPCFFKQGLEAARMVTEDEKKQRKVLKERFFAQFEAQSNELKREVFLFVSISSLVC